MIAIKYGNGLYIRTPYNDTSDLMQYLNVFENNTFDNNVVDFVHTYLIDVNNSNSQADLITGYRVHEMGDDSPPITI